MNQCWLIVNWTLRNKFQSNSNRNTKLFIMKMLSATWQPFCPGRDELIRTCHNKTRKINFGVMMKITGILYVVAFSNMTQHTYIYIHCQTSNIRCTKTKSPIHWSHVRGCREWRCNWGSANIWVINNVIAYQGATDIRGLTVHTGVMMKFTGIAFSKLDKAEHILKYLLIFLFITFSNNESLSQYK